MGLISDQIKKKSFWILGCILLIVFILLMSVFTFADLSVSDRLYNPDSIFGYIFHILGIAPPWVNMAGLFSCLFFISKKKGIKALGITAFIIANICCVIFILDYFGYWFYASAMVLLNLTVFLVIWKLPKQTLKSLFYIFLIITAFYFAETLFVQTFKIFWGRMRYMNLDGNPENFTLWFIPNGMTGHDSFPSGHTSSACTIAALILACFVFKTKPWQKAVLYTISIGFVTATAISRIVLGYHYATDVTFALFTSIAICALAVFAVDKILKRIQKARPASLPEIPSLPVQEEDIAA